MEYCPSPYSYRRRKSRVVRAGGVAIGGENPVRVQSMITCDTMDTAAAIQQTLDLVAVGCEIVRITAPTVKDAANLRVIVEGLRTHGCNVPIVADIHFKPEAALEAARWVEKVRVNPGNYADSKKFKVLEYTDEPLVSVDFTGGLASSVIDGLSTAVIDGSMVKIISWYDNEFGYSARCVDLANFVAERLPAHATA